MTPAAKLAVGGATVILTLPVLLGAAAGGAASLSPRSPTHPMVCAPTGLGAARVAGFGPEQMANAATIVAVGEQMNVPQRGRVVAIATAITESGLNNLDYGDRDSLGLFQQRPSQGWGTPAQIMNPTYSATQFYRQLLALRGWQHMSITNAAQAVQRSAYPNAYAHHEQAAWDVVGAVHGATCTTTTPEAGTWAIPVPGRCSSGFGPRSGQFHQGVDIAAPIGTTIVAANQGRVIDAGPASGYGLWIRIQHPGRVITTYGHNHRNLARTGQPVQAGQPIAEVGDRGQSTGSHLHFQIEVDGRAVDPTHFHRQHPAQPLCP